MRKRLLGLFGAALFWGTILIGVFGMTTSDSQAATLGDPLQNQNMKGTGGTGTGSASLDGTTPWSMYEIPGLNRNHTSSEGSFVQWGYKGWPNASTGTPLAYAWDSSKSDAANATANYNAWTKGQTESPIAIQFQNKVANHGSAYFALNYVDKDYLVDFGNGDDASDVAKAWATQSTTPTQKAEVFNPMGVNSKMNSSMQLDTANGQSFSGGYVQATGNVPIKAAIAAQSPTTVDAQMAGNWAVMVRVRVAAGMAAKSLAASIDWARSYYFLSVDSVSFLGITGASVNINFPLQFDHHVYLDPNNSQQFFLKVKGIPYNVVNKDGFDFANTYGRQLQLQNGNADYQDYLNNRSLKSLQTGATKAAYYLDFLSGYNSNTGGNNANSHSETAGMLLGGDGAHNYGSETNPNWQPRFSPQYGDKLSTTNTVWDPLGGIVGNNSDVTGNWLQPGRSPVYNTGATGRMISMLNAATTNQPAWRSLISGFFGLGRLILQSVVSYFTSQAFTGNAHINFAFDMSKYSAGTSKEEQAITKGRLPAAPNADGTFNIHDGSTADPIQIKMYDSSDLVDPYSTLKGLDRSNTDEDGALRKALHVVPQDKDAGQNGQSKSSGETPADYAVINAANETDLDSKGTNYPVYTNFTSWTGAIVPYDRMHWTDDSGSDNQETQFTDTMHSDGKLGNDIDHRTASPDAGNDGILVNDGQGTKFKVQTREKYLTETNGYGGNENLPQLTGSTLNKAGLIWPDRYANVYQYYDYSSNTVNTRTVDVEPVKYDKQDAEVSVKSASNLSGKQITGNLNGQTWAYTGTLDGYPLADASINLSQTFNPVMLLKTSALILLYRSQVSGTNHYKRQLGYWRDTLASAAGGDTMQLKFIPNIGSTNDQTTNVNNLAASTTSQPILGDWSASNPLAQPGTTIPTSDGITASYQLPLKTMDSANFFQGSGTLTRNGPISAVNGYSVAAGVDNTASDSYDLFLVNGDDTKQYYEAKKEFYPVTSGSGNSDVHILKDGDTNTNVPVKVTVTRKSDASSEDDSSMIIRIPNVQTSTSDVGATISKPEVTDSNGQSATVTATGDTGWLAQDFTSYKVQFSDTPTSFTYTYNYQIKNQDNIPVHMPYADLIMRDDPTTARVLAVSNGVQFAKQKNVNILHVPSMDFGSHNVPGAAAGSYSVTDPADAYFQVQDNADSLAAQTSWSLTGRLGAFQNGDNKTYTDFQIDLGQPMLDAAGKQKETNTSQPGANENSTDYTNEEKNYLNHTPGTMVGNPTSTANVNLYTLNRLLEPQVDASNLIRYYPYATLLTPADMNPTITKGTYTSSITYTVNDDGSL
ncbi:hypothetical protein [Schleiferilactobacillus perolens]|uniref:Uncharacterized protein n=1 Tax=Schleiferilactobacillus perolens DSM 12744 TaxID=1423792 RepID=A0A0R1N8Y2_9LACO|nr:hypothetical protein [Schleiferilactobacillus perolens]KRL13371.1 hypothetical protein FD09_GL002202 [Schleiferilactobacillus perolens DSM 12744]